ncbi:MAG: ABC transporter ATP-binding protein [Candidatus Eremiobacteraeota bacterium]|nr:ABC transporter ATP-binding protein [Candidatus Eremiobacteraeota bacterium]
MSTISIQNLSKSYGRISALTDFSVNIEKGSVFGLLGPNGAGKTTAFKCMLGLARPDTGTVLFDGAPLEPHAFERIGYIPERSVLYDWMTLREHLEMQRRAFARYDVARERELLTLFSLDSHKRVRSLSKGMRTAAAVVMAFAANPDILVLDEPTAGLDPVNQRAVLKLMIDASAQEKTIIFSSHQIGQVERAAETIAILKEGKLLLSGEVDDLKSGWKVVEGIFESDQFSIDGISSDPDVQRIERTGRILRVSVRSDSDSIARRMTELGARDVRTLDLNLEDIFLGAVENRPKEQSLDVLR